MSITKKIDKTVTINCEDTVIISDAGIKVKSEASHSTYKQTHRDTSEEQIPEADYRLLGISGLEKELYRVAIKREKDFKYKFQ